MTLWRMPANFVPSNRDKPHSDTCLELLIVEGISALSAVNQVRENESQSIFAVQGKIPNAATQARKKIIQNAHCQQLFKLLGCGLLENCNPDELVYESVVILSDPDADGVHGQYLLYQLFQQFLTPLLDTARVHFVVAPRYRLDHPGDEQSKYFWSAAQLRQFLHNQVGAEQFNTTVFKGLASLSSKELWHWVVAPQTRRTIDSGSQDPSTMRSASDSATP